MNTNPNPGVQPAPDYTAIKQKQQATWASGNYAVVGTTLQIVGEMLAEAADVMAGERVLDVAAGNGNATLAAARRHATTTSTDYVESLLNQGRTRAEAEGLEVAFRTADVEALPFGDSSFDVVLSTFGVMFAPNQVQSAAEMSRVLRKGGRIGLANWTPDSFIGSLFKVIGRHVPPPAGLTSPALWGDEMHLATLFPGHKIKAERRTFNFRYHSPAHFVQVFRTYYGPTHKAFAALDENARGKLEADVLELIATAKRKDATALVVPSTYLEAVITK